jgi:large subunit ribosomal protein L21
MRTRSLLRATFDIGRTTPWQLPPTFLLPCRARLHQEAASSPTHFQHTRPETLPQATDGLVGAISDAEVQHAVGMSEKQPQPTRFEPPPGSMDAPDKRFHLTRPQTRSLPAQPSRQASLPAKIPPTPSKPLVLSKSLQTLLPLLQAQKPHYVSAHIHRFPYLLTPGDTVRLPFHMHGVNPGDVLRLNRASLLGSRDYTLKAGTNSTESYDGKRTGEPNYLDERLFECRVRVLGLDSGPMMIKEKTKRRQRRVKTARSKHKYTMLKVMEVKVKGLEELKREAGQLILE